MKQTTGQWLRVDPIACDGRGLCAEVLPELITLDDWGFPIIDDGSAPARLRAAANEAVRLCPKLALRLGPAQAAADQVTAQSCYRAAF
jgi:ferredoxin